MPNTLSDTNINTQTAQWGALILRVSLGTMFIAHGLILKYFTFTLAGTAQYFESIGYSGALAYAVFAVETLGGIALVLGFQTRLVALALVPVLIGAMLEHTGNGWVFSAQGGGWEYPAFLIAASVVQALLGGGALAVSKSDLLLPAAPGGSTAVTQN